MFEQAMLLKPYWPPHAPPRVAMPPIKLSLPKPLVVLALSLDALPGLLQAPSMSCFANTKSLRVDNCFVFTAVPDTHTCAVTHAYPILHTRVRDDKRWYC